MHRFKNLCIFYFKNYDVKHLIEEPIILPNLNIISMQTENKGKRNIKTINKITFL